MTQSGSVTAPEFPTHLEWLNTARALSIRELRGKIVVLDFWTYCCINCMHVLSDLERLEQKYQDELVVIGVHSAKFATEQQTENIRQAILRYEIKHPVINDYDLQLFRTYNASSWPSLYLINPEGKVVGSVSGEGVYETLDEAIGTMIEEYDAKGLIDRTPLDLVLERHKAPQGVLSFPGKVHADAANGLLWIADSNNHRIIGAALTDGTVTHVIGNGAAALRDGGFDTASFHHPQGIWRAGSFLWVADTENHAIRRVDLDAHTVSTIAGTGEQGRLQDRGGIGTRAKLNSPWDLLLRDGMLYIAMAGPHQLWVMDTGSKEVRPYAGSGRETIADGTLAEAALAQPSGITTDGNSLYFADSETSSIRSADLPPGDRVETIVGVGLFDFGDVDGAADNVRLQHPLGVVYHDGALYVADTYNNKIKVIDPGLRTSQSFVGSGAVGYNDGLAAEFSEPGGISYANGKLYVADTNNHVVRVVDVASKNVDTFILRDVEKLEQTHTRTKPIVIKEEPVTVAPGRSALVVDVQLPPGHKLNDMAPSRVELTARGDGVTLQAPSVIEQPQFPLELPIVTTAGRGEVQISVMIYYCREGKEGLCFFDEAAWWVRFTVAPGASAGPIQIFHTVVNRETR